jgi:hypothetical protein
MMMMMIMITRNKRGVAACELLYKHKTGSRFFLWILVDTTVSERL